MPFPFTFPFPFDVPVATTVLEMPPDRSADVPHEDRMPEVHSEDRVHDA